MKERVEATLERNAPDENHAMVKVESQEEQAWLESRLVAEAALQLFQDKSGRSP